MLVTSLLAASLALVQQPAPAVRVAATPLVGGVQAGKRISIHADGASLKDVLKELRRQKIDFAVDPEQFGDRKITLNLTDVPLSTALSAIAGALDAHWESVGSVHVLKRGGSAFGAARAPIFGEGFRTFTMPALPQGEFFNSQQAMETARKALEEAQKGLRSNSKLSDEERREAEKAMEEARKALSGSRVEMEKALEEARKAMANQKFDFKSMDIDVQKALEEARKGMSAAPGARSYRGLSPKEAEEFRKAMERIRGTQGEPFRKRLDGTRARIILDGQDFDGLLKSMTAEQKERMKSPGYLKVSDLTPEQRKMAGIRDGGKIEITITKNGETLKIKGE